MDDTNETKMQMNLIKDQINTKKQQMRAQNKVFL